MPQPDAEALGFPTTMFTVLFAVARTVGWDRAVKEVIEDPHQKIGRQLTAPDPLPRVLSDRVQKAENL
ncbi:hypothetical protein MesoLj113b_68950 (plasmid) [Mesorhizobium sp. 113-3-3]|nr:hypothetical protein MesoLj113b_68950 [Mesorhizobium sp. 113-3-3]